MLLCIILSVYAIYPEYWFSLIIVLILSISSLKIVKRQSAQVFVGPALGLSLYGQRLWNSAHSDNYGMIILYISLIFLVAILVSWATYELKENHASRKHKKQF
ncbi:hypothetical protein NBRC111893_428 [Lentilactobacillus kosonis]|uniref:Uncharacterized protein n=2 Tax=Lentilactobacillus kosonis TaxID=2810561 RepID=A0A401FIU1_9LACO|nr:hypothetical protein NBRC111893_428 [Lentilactobacillus kosonis]